MKINTKEELIKQLDINNIDELSEEKNKQQFIGLMKNNTISPKLLTEVIDIVPTLADTLNKLFISLENIGKSIDEKQKRRWDILHDLGLKGKLSSKEILEAMNILGEIEKKENIDWASIFSKIGIGIIVVVGAVLQNNMNKKA